jgi:hypothetical protein
MRPHTTMLAMALLVTGCENTCQDPLPAGETFELDIDTDLHAVVHLESWDGSRNDSFLAVGADGKVLVWGTDYSRNKTRPIVDVFDIGDVDLHAAWADKPSWPSTVPLTWWVVGDDGLIMATTSRGSSWDSVDLQSGADLYGIAGISGRPIIVGDDIIAMRTLDGTWTVLTPPAGGWGQLRGIWAADDNYTAEVRIKVVGLGGVIWTTDDPSGTWTLEPSGVTTDLFAIDGGVAVGAAGTLLDDTDAGWIRAETGVDVDLVDYEFGYALGANGEVYEVRYGEPLTLIATNPGARGLTNANGVWVTVGDGSSTNSPPRGYCHLE